MARNYSDRLLEWLNAFRAWLPNASQDARNLAEEVKDDPSVALRSPYVRVGLIVAGGLVLAMVVYWLGDWIAPADQMGEQPEQVPYRVRCTNPKCPLHKKPDFIAMERGFDDWPAECPKCGKDTLYPYVQCQKCRKWVVPKILDDGSKRCPRCGAPL